MTRRFLTMLFPVALCGQARRTTSEKVDQILDVLAEWCKNDADRKLQYLSIALLACIGSLRDGSTQELANHLNSFMAGRIEANRNANR